MSLFHCIATSKSFRNPLRNTNKPNKINGLQPLRSGPKARSMRPKASERTIPPAYNPAAFHAFSTAGATYSGNGLYPSECARLKASAAS